MNEQILLVFLFAENDAKAYNRKKGDWHEENSCNFT